MGYNFALHSIRFSNYYSFRDEAEIFFPIESGGFSSNNLVFCKNPVHLSNVIAIAGQADARRSNVIKAIVFLAKFISGCFDDSKARNSYIETNSFSRGKYCNFIVEFWLKGKLYRYTLKANDEIVIYEDLQIRVVNGFGCVFTRRHINKSFCDEVEVFGLESDVGDFKLCGEYKSTLLFALEYGSQLAADIVSSFNAMHTGCYIEQTPLSLSGDVLLSAKRLSNHKIIEERVVSSLIKAFGGVLGVELIKIDCMTSYCDGALYTPIVVRANGSKTSLLFEERNMQSFFVLLEKIVRVLENGGVAIIDGIDAEIDSRMLKYLVELFASAASNPCCAQLIFTTSSFEILGYLKRRQVYYVNSVDAGEHVYEN